MRVIGITGAKGSGKSTFAQALDSTRPGRCHVKVMSLADPLKAFVMDIFDFSEKQVYGASEFRESGDGPVTPRKALQTLGTDWGRNLHEDIWIDKLIRDIGDLPEHISCVIVPDVRFVNEARKLRAEFDAHIIEISRPGLEANDTHESERRDGVSMYVTHTVQNTGTSLDLTRMAQDYWRKSPMLSGWSRSAVIASIDAFVRNNRVDAAVLEVDGLETRPAQRMQARQYLAARLTVDAFEEAAKQMRTVIGSCPGHLFKTTPGFDFDTKECILCGHREAI